MPVFQYKAIDAQGVTQEGSETAGNRGEMVYRLKERRLYPVNVKEVVEKDIKDLNVFGRIGIKSISVFNRQFATMLNAGVTIVNCLDILRQQTINKKLRAVIGELYEDVQKGMTLSESLRKHGNVFPHLMIRMIEAGEASGSLDTVLGRVAVHYEKEAKINNRIRSAMIYPLVLLIVCTAVVVFLLTFVMPTYVGMFEGSGMKLPAPTRVLIAMSNSFRGFWYVYILGIATAVYIFRRFAATREGAQVIDRWKLRIPVVRDLTQKVISARFTRTLATLLASGIPLLQAMENVAGAVGNTVVEQGILSAREDVRKGVSLSSPIRKMGHFPPMVDNMIKIGEEAGTLDDILDKTANIYDEEVETEVQRLLATMEPLLIVFMALIVGFIVISMMLPMFDMLKTVN
ncbi:MAG TPA: type II secretion system F family protein [Negativicutes bacterium]|nr:type II secretion system F family protein [Negativicutes bacterium]